MNQRKAGALLSYIQLGLTMVVGIFYTPLLIGWLGESEYGVYQVATSAVGFLAILDLGFAQTMVRYVSRYNALKDREKVEQCNGLFMIFYLAIAGIALIAGIILLSFFDTFFRRGFTPDEAYQLKVVFGILLINLVVSFPLGLFASVINAHEDFMVLKGLGIVSFIMTYGGILLALYMGYRSMAMALITTVVSVGIKIIQAVFALKKYSIGFRFGGFDRGLLGEIFAFSFFIFLNIVIDQLYANTDKFIIGAYRSAAMVTTYTVGVQFASYFEQFSTSISGVFLPRITALLTKDDGMGEVSEIFLRIGRLQFIILGFLMSGFIIYGREFITLWVGEGQTDAYRIALVVIVPALIPLSQNIGISVLRALNKHKFRSVIYIFIAAFNVVLSIPLVIRYGGFGAACATGLATVLGQIITMNIFYYKKIGLDIPGYWKEVVKILMFMIPMACVGALIHILPVWSVIRFANGWAGFIIQCVVYAILFMVFGWIFLFNTYEKDLIRSASPDRFCKKA